MIKTHVLELHDLLHTYGFHHFLGFVKPENLERVMELLLPLHPIREGHKCLPMLSELPSILRNAPVAPKQRS